MKTKQSKWNFYNTNTGAAIEFFYKITKMLDNECK